MKLNLKEIAREIRANEFTRNIKWQFESIEQLETIEDTAYGRLTRYEVVIRYNASKYDDNGHKFQVNHYEDSDSYAVYWNGSTYLA